MLTLTRRQVRSLRAVFRRSTLGISHRGTVPPLLLRAEGAQVCLEHRYQTLGVRCTLPAGQRPSETIALPLEALADVEGRDQSPIMFEATAPERTVVRWEDRGLPQMREHVVPPLASIATLPDLPAAWASCPATLLDALAEACATCDDDARRYALDCLQLRGGVGEIIATDGRQILMQRGYRFPWDGDLLVHRTPLFASRELPRNETVQVGRTDTHFVLCTGNWTIFLELQKDARYPEVGKVLPEVGSDVCRLCLDPADSAFLADAIDRLPGADENNSPVTVDLNGRIAVRASDAERAQTTELILSRSRYTGTPLRINSCRDLLARALRLGFRDIRIAAVEAPVWCHDGNRIYAWQPLDNESAIMPTDDVTRIESCTETSQTAAHVERQPKARNFVNERTNAPTNGTRNHAADESPPHRANGSASAQTAIENAGPVGLTALIHETEALHQTLTEAKRQTARLIAALRRQKKRDKLVASTLTALKELKLAGVNE